MKRNQRDIKVKHFGKPYHQRLQALGKDKRFLEKIKVLRRKWGIVDLLPDPDTHWRAMCHDDARSDDYIHKYHKGETRHQLYKSDLEGLTRYAGFGKDDWFVLGWIVTSVRLSEWEEEIRKLPLPRDIARIDVFERDERLFLDVTFASREDVDEYWDVVKQWQDTKRSAYIAEGRLPNLLQHVKSGRPPLGDKEIAVQCARWKDNDGLTYKQIVEKVNMEYGIDWKIQYDSYENPSHSQTARKYVRLGRELLSAINNVCPASKPFVSGASDEALKA